MMARLDASWLAVHAAPLVAVAAVLVVATVLLASVDAAHGERMRRLVSADRLLSEHAMLLRRLVEADVVPERLKTELLSFSAAAVDDDTFAAIWREACADVARARDISAFNRDLAALYALDPDLGSCFEQAVSGLVMAMVLKSHDALDHLAEAFARAEPRALFASAIDARRRREGGTVTPQRGLLTA